MFKYAQTDEMGRCISVSFLSGEVEAANMKLLTDTDNVNPGDTWDATTSKWIAAPLPPSPTPKDIKIADLKAREATDLKTFKSAALGTPKTYLSDTNDMILLGGEYSFVKGNDYDGKPILWYTVEDGNVSHTAAEFVQVFLDGRNNVSTVKYRRAVKEAQYNACTVQAQLDTIDWPKNPNPPSVPVGLVGVAGATGSSQVMLNWTANTDVTMIGGGGYNVYVDGAVTHVNTAIITATTFSVTALAAGSHTFQITAIDTDGNESVKCTAITITTT